MKTQLRQMAACLAASVILASTAVHAGTGYSAGPGFGNPYGQGRPYQNAYNPAPGNRNALQGQYFPPSQSGSARTGQRPSGASASRQGDSANGRSSARATRTVQQIARDYPPSNSPNPQKHAREAQLRALAEKRGLPAKQRKWIVKRYTHIDNRRTEIRQAEARYQARSARQSRSDSTASSRPLPTAYR